MNASTNIFKVIQGIKCDKHLSLIKRDVVIILL